MNDVVIYSGTRARYLTRALELQRCVFIAMFISYVYTFCSHHFYVNSFCAFADSAIYILCWFYTFLNIFWPLYHGLTIFLRPTQVCQSVDHRICSPCSLKSLRQIYHRTCRWERNLKKKKIICAISPSGHQI